MPIRINLLSEALAVEDLRRRDPVKRTLFIGGFLVALSLVWYSSTLLEFKIAQSKKSLVEGDIQSRTNNFSQALNEQKRITDSQMRLAALQRLSTNRFLMGNLLNAVQQIYVPNVQLTRLKIDQYYTVKAGSPPKTNSVGVVAGSLGSSTERIILLLDAKDSSSNPGDQVNRYKDAVTKLDYFDSVLSKTNGIRLSSLSPPQNSLTGKPFVLFSLECRFADKTR
jgi:hypothetical protein